ncbi:MAG: MerR family DNA-binding protein [Caulobacterales bacterium]|nr:MerR family DNA-binding protein [Caulobacterales bacterium]
MTDLTIGQLAQAGGVGVETVRYYQRRGLIETPLRAGEIRRYGAPVLRRLRFIRAAQAGGFTLEEIGELLALDAGRDRVRARELASARIEALDRKIAELTKARAALNRLARSCAGSSQGPCPIIEAFEPV